MTAAFVNKYSVLVSDDKKFMLKSDVVTLMNKYGVSVMSSDDYISKILAMD